MAAPGTKRTPSRVERFLKKYLSPFVNIRFCRDFRSIVYVNNSVE